MFTERIASLLNCFHRYRAEHVGDAHTAEVTMQWLDHEALHCLLTGSECIPFAHVLNIRPSEEGWLADATELFLPEYFAVRVVGDEVVYREYGAVPDHMRDELYRQSCTPEQVTLESKWRAEHMLYCYDFNQLFADKLFSEPLQDLICPDTWFCDGSDDEPEEDTLNSELLLTEVYYAPDSVSDSSHNPCRPMDKTGETLSPEQLECQHDASWGFGITSFFLNNRRS